MSALFLYLFSLTHNRKSSNSRRHIYPQADSSLMQITFPVTLRRRDSQHRHHRLEADAKNTGVRQTIGIFEFQLFRWEHPLLDYGAVAGNIAGKIAIQDSADVTFDIPDRIAVAAGIDEGIPPPLQ